MRKRICIAVGCLVLGSIAYVACRDHQNRAMGTSAKAELTEMLDAGAMVMLSEYSDPEPSPEFMRLLETAIRRADFSLDADRTQNRWVCACAFYMTIELGDARAFVDQHHLLIADKYYHLQWHGSDLSDLVELWLESGAMDELSDIPDEPETTIELSTADKARQTPPRLLAPCPAQEVHRVAVHEAFDVGF